jgi:hypothetical protein
MLAIARLLISSQRTPGIQPQDIAARRGFPHPGSPHPLDPLQSRPSRLPRANGRRQFATARGYQPRRECVICRSAQLSRRWLCRSAPCRSNILSRAVGPVCMLDFVGLLAGLPHMPNRVRCLTANDVRKIPA